MFGSAVVGDPLYDGKRGPRELAGDGSTWTDRGGSAGGPRLGVGYMVGETTPAVARALDLARRVAAAEPADAVAPRHMLDAMLADPDGRAAAWLVEHGLDVRGFASPETAVPVSATAVPFGPVTNRALDIAGSLARSGSADHVITSDHVLLGLLRADDGLLGRLQARGLRFDALETAYETAHTAPLTLDAPLDVADPVERTDAARVIDASANRAREALRVLEDYVRFSLDDAFLSRQLKEVRHDLTEVLADLPPATLLVSRDTLGDVGTDITTPGEQLRHSLSEVVQANLKRLQEALRSLEEFGKLFGPALGTKLEAIRYRTYTLERALILRSSARDRLSAVKLYVLLSAAHCRAALDWTIAEAAAGGADVIQLREKSLTDRELLVRARDVRRWTRKADVLFIVNDRPDIARLADADGVHLGQDDMPVREARRIVGPDMLIGVSTHNLEQVRRAVLDGASYIGVGPTFASATKDFDELAGLEFVRAATAETSLPAFVLGGVTAANIAQVVAAGGRRVAVSAAVAQADDPRAAARSLRAAIP